MDNNLEQAIDQVLDVLANESSSSKLIQKIRDHFEALFLYIDDTYRDDFTESEFEHLEYGVFLICAVLFKNDNACEIDINSFISSEEKMYQYIEEHKSIQSFFTSISIMDPKIALYNLVEEYFHTMEEEGVSGITRNIIACVMSALL